jgi:hypothetical protein
VHSAGFQGQLLIPRVDLSQLRLFRPQGVLGLGERASRFGQRGFTDQCRGRGGKGCRPS